MIDIITLLTDFGGQDEYVAAVKAKIWQINPDARVIDISHNISPFAVREGALVLSAAAPAFARAVHVAVVDPGVGSNRRAVAVRTAYGHWFVGPDNGILMPALRRTGGIVESYEIPVEGWQPFGVSATFHGRDVFGPAAALISLDGEAPEFFLPFDPEELNPLEFHSRIEAGRVETEAVQIDRFGNARLGITWKEIEDELSRKLTINGHEASVKRYFSEAKSGELFLFEDSSGYACIGSYLQSAAKILNLSPGDMVTIKFLQEEK